MSRNERKRAVLAFLASRGRPATAGEIAWAVHLPYSVRGFYRLLARYTRWGLLWRNHGRDGRWRYGLGWRGKERLRWLEQRMSR